MNDKLFKQLNGLLQNSIPKSYKGYLKSYYSVRNKGQYLQILEEETPIFIRQASRYLSLTSVSTLLMIQNSFYQLEINSSNQIGLKYFLFERNRKQLEGDNELIHQKVKWDELDEETFTKIKLELEKDQLRLKEKMVYNDIITGQETYKQESISANIPDTFQLQTIYYFAQEERVIKVILLENIFTKIRKYRINKQIKSKTIIIITPLWIKI